MERRLVGVAWLAAGCTVVLAGTCYPGGGYPGLADLSGAGILSIVALFAPGLALLSLGQTMGYFLILSIWDQPTSRRRRNWARWLLVVGSVFALVPYLAHVSVLLTNEPIFVLSFVQAALQVTALCYLFTDASRAWFAGRPLQPKEDMEAVD